MRTRSLAPDAALDVALRLIGAVTALRRSEERGMTAAGVLHFVSSDPLATAQVNLASGRIYATKDHGVVALVLRLRCAEPRLLLSKIDALALARQLSEAGAALPDLGPPAP